MGEGVTFIHLSDIHFNNHSGDIFDLDSNIRLKLESDLEKTVRDTEQVTGILITGDIAFSGREEEYELAVTWLKQITTIAGCKEQNVWVIPGNHDVNRSVVDESKIIQMFHDRMRQILDEGDISFELGSFMRDKASESLFEPLEAYIKFASRFSCEIKPSKPFWEDSVILNDGSTLFLRGLTSVLISDRNDDTRANKLVLGSFQTLFPSQTDTTNMVMCHHPPDWFHDQESVNKNLKLSTKLSLFGHRHNKWEEKIETGGNVSIRVHAGAVHPDRHQENWSPRYNLISLQVDGIDDLRNLQIKLQSRIWNENLQIFELDTSSVGDKILTYSIKLPSWSPPTQQVTKVITEGLTHANGHDQTGEQFPEDLDEGGQELNRSRRLTYRFLTLPYHEIVKIGTQLEIIEDSDDGLSDFELVRNLSRRAREKGLILKLQSEVEKRHANDIVKPEKGGHSA